MFYFIHPTDENFPALWYRQYLGLSEQHRLNILLKGSHITTCTETSNPLAIKSERQLRSTLSVQACVWPMHVNVESLLLGGGGHEYHSALEHFSCNCNKGEMKAVWCITTATDMFSWSWVCSVACLATTCLTDQLANILLPLSSCLKLLFLPPPLQLHSCYWCRYLLISLPECPL